LDDARGKDVAKDGVAAVVVKQERTAVVPGLGVVKAEVIFVLRFS
jgi:hypothetical protein